MARVIGDTVEMTITSDEEESDSEADPHPLQQASPGSVLVEDSRDVHVGPRLTYNGPVTVNQIVQAPSGNSGCNEDNEDLQHAIFRQAIDIPGSYTCCTDPLRRTTEVNQLKCDAETNYNAAGMGQGEVPHHRQAPSMIATVKKLLSVVVGVITFSIAIYVVIQIVRRSSEIEKSANALSSSIQLSGGHSKQY